MIGVSSVVSTSSTSFYGFVVHFPDLGLPSVWESPSMEPPVIIRITPLQGGSLESVLSFVPILGPPFGEAFGLATLASFDMSVLSSGRDRFLELSPNTRILGGTHSG
ncbi:UNVERIFIED_CONTAM: hypothetical protein Slati_3103500 [Sesamum latifolium]|uniref:Uncharacterized protein n=1 Tax=Sesamum latifolium TaxID=2727402 RepID=A0AAW2V082_9LAMI